VILSPEPLARLSQGRVLMNLFDKADQQATLWVKDMMSTLDTEDAHLALHALRAGLHALRDRLTVAEAAQLSAQLPLVIRGLFFEGWVPTGKPLRIRHRAEFLALVREKYAPREDAAADEIVAALFHVLGKHVSAGELTDIMMILPEEIVELVSGAAGTEERSER
jgi:uncharacterized protein (DUF2267 family)